MSPPVAEGGLFLDGLRCAGCALRVERALREVPGVEGARVNYATGRALVSFDPSATDSAALADSVEQLGYGATPYDPAALERPATRRRRSELVRVLVAGFLAGNVMVVALALYLGSYQDIDPEVRRALRVLSIALSLPAVTYCAAPFWRGALSGLARRELTIDVPVVLGVGAAFGVSIAGTLGESEHVFVDSAAVIVFLILLGRYLEGTARANACGAVERLLAAVPETAQRRGANGTETVAVLDLVPGDVVVVPPGARIPTDGRIVTGESELDEALLTGESLPVYRANGASVRAGTHNVLAEIDVEVTARAVDGTVAKLAALIERAQAERPHIQLMADRVAAVFAPLVLVAAAAVCAYWIAVGASPLDVALTGAAVLIVACPCALALATPAAFSTAIGRAARFGILFKSGDALERCAGARRAVIDKTGTLTEGELEVVAAGPAEGVSRDELIVAAARVEGASSHPVSRAIQRIAGAEPQPCAGGGGGGARQIRPGLGVVADDERVGRRALLEEAGIEIPDALEREAEKHVQAGESLAWVSSGRNTLGWLALCDTPRPEARRAVALLESNGVGVHLVTGDHELAARRAAEDAGIREWTSEALPEDKVTIVRQERVLHGSVIVAGDGVNDAAALAAGDAGIALARGADATVDAADVVLVPGPRGLCALPAALGLARATLRRVREGLTLAVAYNVLAVPLAAAGLLHPLAAAAAMSLSSLLVTANALRLRRWTPEP